MIGTIKLTRFLSSPDDEDNFARHNWPLVVHATSTGEMPDAVFVFQKFSGIDPANYDTFHNVASAHDIFEIPTAPTSMVQTELDTPFYRGNQVRLFLRNPEEVEELWEKLKADVRDLVRNLEAENRLKAVDITTFTPLDTTPITVDETVDPLAQVDQVLLSLNFRPCGVAEVGVGNTQSISSPNTAQQGWLPISEAPAGLDVPANAVYFYNTDQDAPVGAELPFLEPGATHLLYLNGSKLTHGITYAINSTGLFWLTYNPVGDGSGAINNDELLLANNGLQGNAPWPLDQVDNGTDGASIPEFQLLLFRE